MGSISETSGSNPVSCSETSIKIYGSKEEIWAQKSPETVDAPGFAPDASIPVILYGAAGQIRTADLILTKRLSVFFITISACIYWFLFQEKSFPELFRSTTSVVSIPVCGGNVVKHPLRQVVGEGFSLERH